MRTMTRFLSELIVFLSLINLYSATVTELADAAESGDLDRVIDLIENEKINYTIPDVLGDTVLHLAARNERLPVLKYLLENTKMDVNLKGQYGRTALHLAALKGNLPIVQYLIENGTANYRISDDDNDTPMHLAAWGERLPVLKYLLGKPDIDVNLKGLNGMTALHYAAAQGHLLIVQYLIENRTANYHISEIYNFTPMHLATIFERLPVLKYFLENTKMDVNLKGPYGRTALHLAVRTGNLPIVQYLIERKALRNITDDSGRTALQYAVDIKRTSVVQYLMEDPGDCLLPPQPANGRYTNQNSPDLKPGDIVAEFSTLTYSCNGGYTLHPQNKYSLCAEGNWTANYKCLKTCPPLRSDSIDFTCNLNGVALNCSGTLPAGTTARMRCKRFYEREGSSAAPVIRCRDGRWDRETIRCNPVCGQVTQKAQQFIIDGQATKQGDFPWHVAVYRKKASGYEYICGGSVVTLRLVLSAAHCFTDHSYGAKQPVENYLMVAGKYYRSHDDPRDQWAQKSEVEEIVIRRVYRGVERHYADDIAVAVLQNPFVLSAVVQPVCLDWDNTFEHTQLISGSLGTVVGWGLTSEGGDFSKELKQLSVPVIEAGQCLDVVPESFRAFVTGDKFCAGYTNGSSVCSGDSGGGLVFQKPDTKRFFIRGIVSNGPWKGLTCDSMQYTLYTKISRYLDFIQDAVAEYGHLNT